MQQNGHWVMQVNFNSMLSTDKVLGSVDNLGLPASVTTPFVAEGFPLCGHFGNDASADGGCPVKMRAVKCRYLEGQLLYVIFGNGIIKSPRRCHQSIRREALHIKPIGC